MTQSNGMEASLWRDVYQQWLAQPDLDPEIWDELVLLWDSIEGEDAKAIEEGEDRFYRELAFGTGGLRGKLGAGTNRMNRHTIEKTTRGVISYIKKYALGQKVAIGYDSRIMSREFGELSARLVKESGLTAYIYDTLMPAPALSFATRYHECAMGIMITASHNPSEYNGYKVYNSRGCQVTEREASLILEEIQNQPWFPSKQKAKSGVIHRMGKETKEAYYQQVLLQRMDISCEDLNLVYSPLNGAGLEPVQEIFRRIQVGEVWVVPEQEAPDGNFPTCPYPNPEKKEALALSLQLAQKHQADMVMATDPDCDRVGIGVRHQGEYYLPTGNEVGLLLADFLCQQRMSKGTLPKNPLMVRTIVTTPMVDCIGKNYGVRVEATLTGFKYIGEKIGTLEDLGRIEEYIFGFEESYGYLAGTYVRDKDGVNAVMLICEMAAWYKKQGKTLIHRLEELYQEYGYTKNRLLDFQFPGAKGMETMGRLMAEWRKQPPQEVVGYKVQEVVDYLPGGDLPPSDVVEVKLQGETGFTIRPSGTEPKLKIYLFGNGNTREEVEKWLENMADYFTQWVKEKGKESV